MPETLNPAMQAELEAVGDDELAEATDMCALSDIPAEYARNLAAVIAVCTKAGA